MNRAYSLFEIKSADDASRTIEGLATTPSTDRMGDVVEPKGAQFTLPVPFLWQHKHDSPIGHVTHAEVTDEGILVRVQVARDEEPGPLKDLLDKAWRSIKKGLVRGLSIGFAPLEQKPIKGTFGLQFTKWDWLELSAVTIPANAQATIHTVKSFSAPAATGTATHNGPPPGASGIVRLTPKKADIMQTTQEQIKSFEAERAAKDAQRRKLMDDAAAKGETLDDAAEQDCDTLDTEIEKIDRHLVRLHRQADSNAAAAVPVPTVPTQKDATAARGGLSGIKVPVKADPGVRFARLAKCIGLAGGVNPHAAQIAANRYGEDTGLNEYIKGAVNAASTSETAWAANLVGDETSLFADFADFLRPQTILGKFGAGGIPSLRRVPFRVPLISQTSGGAAYWVGEGLGKGLTSFAFGRTTLEPLKVANIAVATMELLRDSSPSADGILRDQLAAALRERLDIDFVDSSIPASSGVKPAAITDGISPTTSNGNTAADVRIDIKAAMESFIAANNAPTSGVWIMPSTVALGLSLLYNANGVPEFPGVTLSGGTLFGLPVITSEYVPSDSDGAIVVLVNASDIYLGDEGGVRIDVSREASLKMDTAPTGQASLDTPAESVVVSMFQTNSVAFLAERTINWKLRRASAVAVIDGVNWGAGS